MPEIKIIPLGAGQDVGRSCFIVSLGEKNIMLDCGMHMGYNDDRRFPDFSYITKYQPLSEYLHCVIISHFHLDHCGALPYMTEMVGYDGPIYMTNPTKAICPILLEDFRKITVEKRGISNFFTTAMIEKCMRKVKTVSLHEVVKVGPDLEIKAYYAGHVLGAGMFYVRSGCQSILYTGDYNMTPDRHLGSAWVDCCRPDLLITESTYATTIRDSKRCRERDFLDKVHKCVEAGGKVLIPVFALGRAQELCILLESYWDRMNLDIPIFFTTGMTQQATAYYKLFISWTNEKIKDTFVERNMFDFKHIKPLPQGVFESDGPMVVFATPGMLHAGQSLQIFKKWAPNKNNMVILPGYCVAGTIGYKILNGAKKLEFEKNTLDVRMKVEYLSFSAHADAKGIMQLINQCRPNNIMLVHGEAAKMEFLKSKIDQEFNIPCYMPANGELLTITKQLPLTVKAPVSFLRKKLRPDDAGLEGIPKPKIFRAAIVMDAEESHSNASPSTYHLMDRHEALSTLNESEHELQFTCNLTFKTDLPPNDVCTRLMKSVTQCLISLGCSPDLATLGPDGDSFTVIDNINVLLKDTFIHEEPLEKEFDGDSQHMDVVGEKSRIVKSRDVTMHVTYSYLDEYFGSKIYISLKEEVAKWAE